MAKYREPFFFFCCYQLSSHKRVKRSLNRRKKTFRKACATLPLCAARSQRRETWPPNHKCWREAIRFVAVSQPGAGAFLNAIPMRDDMKMESWAMRVTVQRRLGLPLDVACQAAEAGKRAPNGQLHDILGDAAMVNPRSKHATRHKFLLKRLVKTLRSAWGA